MIAKTTQPSYYFRIVKIKSICQKITVHNSSHCKENYTNTNKTQ